MKNQNDNKTKHVEQARGPELREKMKQSEIEGEEYRRTHRGADTRKIANTSNTDTKHKADR